MKVCWNEGELADAFATVERLSRSNFKESGIFLEKFVPRARHIEVQIFGDGEGRVLALGERDCSAQRRNQKVIEETPAPGLTDTPLVLIARCDGRFDPSDWSAAAGCESGGGLHRSGESAT